jgi:Na+/melibiose symporter-like transporter
VTYNALMLVYTAINIPYTALMGVITTNPLERTALSSIKYVGAFAGGMIIAATLLPMAKVGGWLGAQTVERGWQLCFVIYGIAACICFTHHVLHDPRAGGAASEAEDVGAAGPRRPPDERALAHPGRVRRSRSSSTWRCAAA